jgi:hypothetical protein
MRLATSKSLNRLIAVVAVAWAPLLVSARSSHGPAVERDASEMVQRILGGQYGLAENEVRKVERGKVITEVLDRGDDHEVTILSIMKVTASRQHLLSYARELQHFANTGFMTQFGSLAQNDLVSDVQALEVRQEDLKAVRSCALADCDMKLPESIIRAIAALDREDDDFAPDASAIILGWLRDYLVRYRNSEDPALVVFADRREPQPLAAALERLLAGSSAMSEAAPGLHRFLAAGQVHDRSALEESYYWSVEEFGMRPLTTVTHQVIYMPDTSSPSEIWVAQKLLYASHYLQGSLRVARLVEDVGDGGEPVSYLIYQQQLMFDGRVGGLKRTFLTSALQRNLHARMRRMRKDLQEANRISFHASLTR